MRPELVALFRQLKETPAYHGVRFDDVNDANSDGDNALHWAVHSNDLAAARLLISAGIEVDKRGDLGRTPLHEACDAGQLEMVRLLVDSGADLYALTEGEIPFSLARLAGRDDICAVLRPLMETAQRADSDIVIRMRIKHLQSEIARLERLLR